MTNYVCMYVNSLIKVLEVECSPSRELYCDFIVVGVLWTHCVLLRSCVLAYLPIPFSFILIHDVVGLFIYKFVVVVGVASVYRFNVKRWFTISIFLTVCWVMNSWKQQQYHTCCYVWVRWVLQKLDMSRGSMILK